MQAPRPLVADPDRPVRTVLYGVQHSHAAGKVSALKVNPRVELAGVYEPDPQQRAAARDRPAYAGLPWLDSPADFLEDPQVVAVCVEGPEGRCAGMAREAVGAGKHIWYDKPAGDWEVFRETVAIARQRDLHIQMGYMLRYNGAFRQIGAWLREGLLGELYAIRGHMSTYYGGPGRGDVPFPGGVAFQLAPHMMDQVLWLFDGRPQKVTAFLRNDATPGFPRYADNTLVVLEYPRGMASIDIAALEAPPPARRFEVYGTRGSAIVLEPFEPGGAVRLCLVEASGDYVKGEQRVDVAPTPRAESYHHELAAFVGTLQGRQAPDRSLDHELLVEETLHRAVGTLAP